MPVWAFHGADGEVVRPAGSFAMVEAMRACPGITGAAAAKHLSGTHHSSWEPAYHDPALYRWLLEQRRTAPAR